MLKVLFLSYEFWWKVKSFFFLIVDIKEETTSKVTDNNKKITDIKTKVEQETKEKEFTSSSNSHVLSIPPVLSQEINKRNTNIKKKSQNAKGKRKKKEDSFTVINEKIKPEEQEDCVDVETIPRDEVPGI